MGNNDGGGGEGDFDSGIVQGRPYDAFAAPEEKQPQARNNGRENNGRVDNGVEQAPGAAQAGAVKYFAECERQRGTNYTADKG